MVPARGIIRERLRAELRKNGSGLATSGSNKTRNVYGRLPTLYRLNIRRFQTVTAFRVASSIICHNLSSAVYQLCVIVGAAGPKLMKI